LKAIDVPTLIIHGDDDQIVPIGASARAAVKLVKKAKLIEYKGGPHGVCHHRERPDQRRFTDLPEIPRGPSGPPDLVADRVQGHTLYIYIGIYRDI
jgi:alpha-beta hydrolase superfamily lysophospholipase